MAFHPHTDGQTECADRVIVEMLRHSVDPLQSYWNKHSNVVEVTVNQPAWQESIQTSPFMLNNDVRAFTAEQPKLRSKVSPTAKFPNDWQLTFSKDKRLSDSAFQRHGL